MSFKNMCNRIHKCICCRYTSCILWEEFGDTVNRSDKDVSDFIARKKELKSQ